MAVVLLCTPAAYYLNAYSSEGWTVMLVLPGFPIVERARRHSGDSRIAAALMLSTVSYLLVAMKPVNVGLCMVLVALAAVYQGYLLRLGQTHFVDYRQLYEQLGSRTMLTWGKLALGSAAIVALMRLRLPTSAGEAAALFVALLAGLAFGMTFGGAQIAAAIAGGAMLVSEAARGRGARSWKAGQRVLLPGAVVVLVASLAAQAGLFLDLREAAEAHTQAASASIAANWAGAMTSTG